MSIDFKKIITVEAIDMPVDVVEWCMGEGYSTHYEHTIVAIENSNNPFANWLRANGYKFVSDDFDWIGIFGS